MSALPVECMGNKGAYSLVMTNAPKFPITGEAQSDKLLEDNPLALVIGMLLDQQVTMEWAFKGPYVLKERLGDLDPQEIASMDEEKFAEIASTKPAIHRYPKAMAKRIQVLCEMVSENYGGDVSKIWRGQRNAKDVLKRLQELPGYGAEKSKIFTAILVKRFGYQFEDFDKACAPFSGNEPRSAAHVDSAQALLKVREWKKAAKAKKKLQR